MQKNRQKISPIKQRILQFVDTLNISKRDFYAKIQVSRGTLESHTGITEDILAKFIATYDEISIEWLITGKGNMIRKDSDNEMIHSPSDQEPFIDYLKETIIAKDKFLIDKDVRIEFLISEISRLQTLLKFKE